MTARDFTIFGAGLSGPLMAVSLARAGHRVELFERRPDPRSAAIERGRSINLALSTRGIDALARVGLAEGVLAGAVPMPGRMIHPRTGPLAFQPYSAIPGRRINSVSRAGLNIAILDAAERERSVRIHFGRRCVGVDIEGRTAEVLDESGGGVRTIGFAHLIGADGAYSSVRSAMLKRDRFDFEQSYLTHGYKELTIPAGPGGAHRIEPHALHIWPRGSHMMIALPNLDGSFTGTVFWPFEGPHSFAALRSAADIRAFFEDQFPDAVPLIPDLIRDFQENPTSSLVTVRCRPWHVEDRIALIGDAAHAVVPFYGQGMNASFEDCVALAAEIERTPEDIAGAFARYGTARRPHTDALSRLAIENFLEMRDKAGRADFRRRKSRERWMARALPRWYTPLYDLVSFTTIPYADAVARAARQDRVVRRIAWLIALTLALVALALLRLLL